MSISDSSEFLRERRALASGRDGMELISKLSAWWDRCCETVCVAEDRPERAMEFANLLALAELDLDRRTDP